MLSSDGKNYATNAANTEGVEQTTGKTIVSETNFLKQIKPESEE